MAAILSMLALAGLARAEEGARLNLTDIARLAMDADSRGALERGRLQEQRARGAMFQAQGAFDWNLNAQGGYRRLLTNKSSAGSVSTDIEFVDVLTASLGGEKLFENGIRVRPGFIVSSGADQSQLTSALLRSTPVLEVDVPLDASWGEPLEAMSLEAARSDLEAARLQSGHARQAYLARAMKAAWALLAAQRKYGVSLAQAAVAEDVAGRMLRLLEAREISRMTADEVLNRAESRRNAVDQAGLDLASARLDLALLLRVEEAALGRLDTDFPQDLEAPDEERTRQMVAVALQRRLDLQGDNRRVESARQRAKATRRQVDSSLVLQAGQDRLMLNWTKPLGENRDLGARDQAQAEIGLASLEADDARRKIEVEIRMAKKRLGNLAATLPRARLVADRVAERLSLTRQLVEQGRQPATSLLDAADQLGNAQSQLIDLELARAQTLADLRLASASIPEPSSEPAVLAATFTRLP